VLFHFILRPTADIAPWGEPDDPSLSWFGLSDGWYWLAIDEDEIFRTRGTPPGEPPFVGYQVVRLWEDLLDLLPIVLTPVPPPVADRIGADPLGWARAMDESTAEHSEDEHDIDAAALECWRSRRLDTGHLQLAAQICFWRVGDVMHIVWMSRPEGNDLWARVQGVTRMPVDTFLEEVRDFDARFIGAMRERVEQVLRAGGRPGVRIDLEHLEREQSDRSLWYQGALARIAGR
jgi:hypothetical protein